MIIKYLAVFVLAIFSMATTAQGQGMQSITGDDEPRSRTPERASPKMNSTGQSPQSRSGNFDTRSQGSTSGASPDAQLAVAAQKYKHAVGLVVVGGEAVGTAWAIGRKTFATNGHVVRGVEKFLKMFKSVGRSAKVYIAINGRRDLQYTVTGMKVHAQYGKIEVNYNGVDALGNYDVGLLTINEETNIYFLPAPLDDLRLLRAGQKVGYLGFPMEGLAGDNVNNINPLATMQTGILTTVSNYFMEDKEPKYLLRHNLPVTGGASGSPIFRPDGRIVGIHFASNKTRDIFCEKEAKLKNVDLNCRGTTNAALVNFAERADLIFNHKNWMTIPIQ